jgi:rhodanese-related sulfurtransferase
MATGNHILQRSIIIVLIAVVLAVTANLVNPHRIPWVQYWPDPSESDTVWLSPSYVKGEDPPAIPLGLAVDRYYSDYLFVDAREAEEYETGHIEGAILLPFDYFDEYWPEVEPLMPVDTPIVVYCSGSECESSLNLARVLVEDFGYQTVEIFFGGWRSWYNNRLPIEGERGYDGEQGYEDIDE